MQDRISDSEKKEIASKTALPLLWVAIGGLIMVFAGLTSAYIVRSAEGRGWLMFKLPELFWFSTAVILCSSFTMNFAVRAARKNNFTGIKTGVIMTMALGIAFCILQVFAWYSLYARGINFTANISANFLFIISGLHFAHIIAGLVALSAVSVKSVNRLYNANDFLGLRLCATFWHFLDGLWIYLFLFLLLMR